MKQTKIFVFVAILAMSCSINRKESKQTRDFVKEGYLVEQWMELLFFNVKHEIVGPPSAARIYSYVGVAMYESVVHGMPEYQSLAGQLNGLDNLPQPDPGLEYDWPTVMCESMYHVSDAILSQYISGSNQSLNELLESQIAERTKTVSKKVIEQSREFGRQLGEKIVEWSESDGFDDIRLLEYDNPSRVNHPEYYELTDINIEPLEPFWGMMRPMVLDSANSCSIKLPFEYSTDTSSAFYKQATIVYESDKAMTEEQRQIALYWADCPGETATPPGHWTTMMNAAIKSHQMNLEKVALMYGLVSLGMNDAFIQCWYTKYDVNLVRPKTYIQENFPGEENWEPYVITPPFPEFASGHSVVSGCVSELLTHVVGDNTPFVDSTHVKIGLQPRSFNSFRDAAKEAASSRLYGGMHYPIANDLGLKQGQCVAQNILNKVNLKKQ